MDTRGDEFAALLTENYERLVGEPLAPPSATRPELIFVDVQLEFGYQGDM